MFTLRSASHHLISSKLIFQDQVRAVTCRPDAGLRILRATYTCPVFADYSQCCIYQPDDICDSQASVTVQPLLGFVLVDDRTSVLVSPENFTQTNV